MRGKPHPPPRTGRSSPQGSSRGGPRRRLVPASALVALASLFILATAGAAPPPAFQEYALKAAYLYNFAKYVEWPADAFASVDAPLVIGILGPNPFGGELERVVKGRHINGREVVVRSFDSAADAAGAAHLVFTAAGERESAADLRLLTRTRWLLTVGESDAFAEHGGAITFRLDGDRLGFEINAESATRAGLRISAQLQKLAVVANGS